MSERASKSPRAQEARHPNPACPKDEASNLPLAGGTGRSKACTRETRRAPPRFARDRVNPCYFVVLRSEIGSFDEIAGMKDRDDAAFENDRLLTWAFSWTHIEAEVESAPDPYYLVESGARRGKKTTR